MKFLHFFNKSTGFDKIEGYEDIKDIVLRVVDSEENYNLLFIGPPASAKTLFLLGILDIRKNGARIPPTESWMSWKKRGLKSYV